MRYLSAVLTTGCVFAASTAYGQNAPSCGGIGGVGAWIGGNANDSDIAVAAAPFQSTGTVPLGGHHVVLFGLSAAAEIRVEVAPQPGVSGDTTLQIWDAGGTLITEDDDSGGNLASRAELALGAGQYCVAARSFDSAPLPVDIRVGLQSHEALTAGTNESASEACTPETDAALLSRAPMTYDMIKEAPLSARALASDTPFHRFTLSAPAALSFTAEGENTDPVLALYDESGELIEENDDADGLNSRIDASSPLAAGTYCLGLRDLGDGSSPITLSVTAYDPVAARLAQIALAEIAPTPADETPVDDLGQITTLFFKDVQIDTDAVWHRFDVPDSSLVLIEALTTSDVDPILVLFDRVGRKLGYNDDMDGLSSQIAARVSPGGYLLAVMPVDGTPAGDVRLVLERFKPAQ